MKAEEVLIKTFEGSRELKLGAKALGVYYANLNLGSILNPNQAAQLAAIMFAYLFATRENPTWMERLEDRIHAKGIIKELVGISWYRRFNFDKWLETFNWTTENATPYEFLGNTIDPTFWITQFDLVAVNDNKENLKINMKYLVVAPTEEALELPHLDKVNLF